MRELIMKCKKCDSIVKMEHIVRTLESFLYCEKCKIHEVILRHEDFSNFYKIEVSQ